MSHKTAHQQNRGIAMWGIVGLLGLIIAAGMLRPHLNAAKVYQPAIPIDDETQEAVNSTPFALILGEVRATAADLMWIKTERYLHRGVAYAAHIDAEVMANSGQVASKERMTHQDREEPAQAPASLGAQALEAEHEQGHEEEHEGMTSLTPDAAKDYRGFIGTLDRSIQPWLPPGSADEHSGGDELLPWYRLLTYSNPHHWRGYMIGTWWLMSEAGHDPKAMGEAGVFIAEGIRNNPNVFQLPLMQGRWYYRQEKWTAALDSFRQSVSIGLKIRPRDWQIHSATWTESDEEDFRAAVRYLPAICFRKLNDPAEAQRQMSMALQLIPDDKPLQDLAKQMHIN